MSAYSLTLEAWRAARPAAPFVPSVREGLHFRRPDAGVTVDALLFGVLWLAWLTSRQYNRVLQRLSRKERIRITWGLRGEPRITVVKAAAGAGGQGPVGTASRSHSRSLSRSLSLGTPHLRLPSLPAAAGEAGAAAAAAELGGSSRAGHGADGSGGVLTKSGGLLGFAQRRRAPGGLGHKAKAGQVWAAWGGPGADEDGGYQPLLDDPPSPHPLPPHAAARQLGSNAGDEAPDATHAADSFELAVARRTLSAGGMHARHVSITNEDEMTPRQLHSLLVARHRQSLGSPLSSMHAGLGEGGAGMPVTRGRGWADPQRGGDACARALLHLCALNAPSAVACSSLPPQPPEAASHTPPLSPVPADRA